MRKMFVLVAGLAAASAFAVSWPVTAQMTGSRLGRNASSGDAKGVLDVMVRCVGERNPRYASRVMLAVPGSKTEHQTVFSNAGDLGMCMDDRSRRLIIGDNVEMRMTARSFRLGLAKVMARTAVRGIEPVRLASAVAWSPALYTAGEVAEADKMQLGLYQFGDCVVAAKPSDAVALVSEGIASAEGKKAVQAIIPVLGGCLNQGAELTLTPETLAIAVAEPLYFRARAIKADEAVN